MFVFWYKQLLLLANKTSEVVFMPEQLSSLLDLSEAVRHHIAVATVAMLSTILIGVCNATDPRLATGCFLNAQENATYLSLEY